MIGELRQLLSSLYQLGINLICYFFFPLTNIYGFILKGNNTLQFDFCN